MVFFVLFFKEKYSFCLLVIGSRVPKTSEPIISKEPCAVVLGTERNVSSQDTSHKSMGMKLPGCQDGALKAGACLKGSTECCKTTSKDV